MTDHGLEGTGDRSAPGGSAGTIAGDENASTITPAVREGDTSRSDRDPGQTPRGDDDWGSEDAGQALGPADMPTDPSESVAGD